MVSYHHILPLAQVSSLCAPAQQDCMHIPKWRLFGPYMEPYTNYPSKESQVVVAKSESLSEAGGTPFPAYTDLTKIHCYVGAY